MARNILNFYSKLQTKRMKSTMVQTSNTKKCWTKTLVAALINVNNKVQAKENRVKKDDDVTIL